MDFPALVVKCGSSVEVYDSSNLWVVCQVLGLRLTQMTLQRGWNNKSKLLVVSLKSSCEVVQDLVVQALLVQTS